MVPKYLDLQTRLYNLRPEIYDKPKKGKKGQSAGATVEDPQTLKLQRKISSIENDVLFDRKEAEHLWREKLGDLRKEAAIFRRAEADTEKEQVDQNVPEPEPEPEAAPILEDGEAGDLLGDMFQTEEEPTLELGVITEELNKASIAIRDFGKWTGLSPRRVLEEACKARYATFAFHIPYFILTTTLTHIKYYQRLWVQSHLQRHLIIISFESNGAGGEVAKATGDAISILPRSSYPQV